SSPARPTTAGRSSSSISTSRSPTAASTRSRSSATRRSTSREAAADARRSPRRVARSPRRWPRRSEQPNRPSSPSFEGPGARLRLGPHRRGRPRPARDPRPAALHRRAGRDRRGRAPSPRPRPGRGGRAGRRRTAAHAPRGGRRPGRGDEPVRRATARRPGRARRDLRRAVHHHPCGAGRGRRRPGRRAPAVELPGTEPGLTRPTRQQIYRRRVVALVVVCVVVGACAWGAYAVVRNHRDASPPPPTTTAPARTVLSVLFPEGFTRQQMAQRAHAVSPAVGTAAYLRATRSSALPGRFAGDGKNRSLEGFLFPATYDIYDDDPAQVLIAKQLAAFTQNWGRVKLGYARSKNLTPYDVLIIASMIEKEVVVPRERPLVAAGIYTRLHQRMRRGIDATRRYGLGIPPTTAITKRDLASTSPF